MRTLVLLVGILAKWLVQAGADSTPAWIQAPRWSGVGNGLHAQGTYILRRGPHCFRGISLTQGSLREAAAISAAAVNVGLSCTGVRRMRGARGREAVLRMMSWSERETQLEKKGGFSSPELPHDVPGVGCVEVIYNGEVCVRSEASLFAKEIGVVEKGEFLRVVESETVHGVRWLKLKGWTGWSGNKWVTHPVAWICEEISGTPLLRPAASNAWHPIKAAGCEVWRVAKHCDLTVRCGPGASEEATRFLRGGDMFEVEDSTGEWLKIRARSMPGSSGGSGGLADEEEWVCPRGGQGGCFALASPLGASSSDRVGPDHEWRVVVPSRDAAVRAGPSHTAPATGGATKGELLTVLGIWGGWLRLPDGDSGGQRWISASAAVPAVDPPTALEEHGRWKVICKAGVQAFAAPYEWAETAGMLECLETVEATLHQDLWLEVRDRPGSLWVRAQSADGGILVVRVGRTMLRGQRADEAAAPEGSPVSMGGERGGGRWKVCAEAGVTAYATPGSMEDPCGHIAGWTLLEALEQHRGGEWLLMTVVGGDGSPVGWIMRDHQVVVGGGGKQKALLRVGKMLGGGAAGGALPEVKVIRTGSKLRGATEEEQEVQGQGNGAAPNRGMGFGGQVLE